MYELPLTHKIETCCVSPGTVRDCNVGPKRGMGPGKVLRFYLIFNLSDAEKSQTDN